MMSNEGFNIKIDWSKAREMPGGSVIIGDENGVLINGDFLLELLTKEGVDSDGKDA